MNIRRQKQIKAFLVEEFGADRGNALFHSQEKTLYTLIENEGDKSGAQRKTPAQTILPCIALYKALLQDSSLREGAHGYVQKYMLEKAAAEKHASPAKMEAVPGFYRIYNSVFLKIMRISDLWESEQRSGKDCFDVTIKSCLWHTACAENGCPELCRLFCDADNVTYGGLRKIGFSRTKTLGCGADCCDFHFFRK